MAGFRSGIVDKTSTPTLVFHKVKGTSLAAIDARKGQVRADRGVAFDPVSIRRFMTAKDPKLNPCNLRQKRVSPGDGLSLTRRLRLDPEQAQVSMFKRTNS